MIKDDQLYINTRDGLYRVKIGENIYHGIIDSRYRIHQYCKKEGKTYFAIVTDNENNNTNEDNTTNQFIGTFTLGSISITPINDNNIIGYPIEICEFN